MLTRGEALDAVLEHEEPRLARLDPRDRAFARALVSVTLRRLGQVEAALRSFLKKGMPASAPGLRPILALGGAQILFLSVPDHAAVDLSVRLAAADPDAKHFTSLVNAVLRALAREGSALLEAQDVARLNVPPWLWQRWCSVYGEDPTRRMVEVFLTEPPLDITCREAPEQVAAELSGWLLPTGTVRLVPEGPVSALPGYEDGRWWVQDAAAAIPARLLGEVKGLRVADLCAAPGGKTAQLAAAGAGVVAVDRSGRRLARLAGNLARLRLRATAVAADVLEWEPGERFDAVILDAPCTGTGTIRRHPDILHARKPSDLSALVELQTRLLRRAVDLVRPGGLLVYSTCSLEPEEGEAQIERLIGEGAPVRRIPIAPDEVGGLNNWLTPTGDLRTFPWHMPGTTPRLSGVDGFFAARLRRDL